jgi:hypothetical protein
MDWFMNGIHNGFFEVLNPYNRKVSKVPATPETVHTIVFWSKNFGPFLSGNYGERLMEMGYHLYFNFTVNSDNPKLEPNVPSLTNRLEQLKELCSRFNPAWIDWRFDPICFYEDENGKTHDNLTEFSRLAETASQIGIHRCITSFLDLYKKVQNRVRRKPDISFIDQLLDRKSEIILDMAGTLIKKDIRLYLCCEKELLDYLPPGSGVKQSACIPNHRLKELFGGDISLERDKGQRVKSGCGCRVSVDIGSYPLHPCYHNCLFCYANPTAKSPTLIDRK